MFDNSRLKEAFILNSDWVKRLRKGTDLEDIGKAIRERIESPKIIGPYIHDDKGEISIDIITALMEVEPDLRSKIEKAVGLLLYKMKHGELTPSQEIYQGIFGIIRINRFVDCRTLLHNWIKDNIGLLTQDTTDLPFYDKRVIEGKRVSYKEALLAFAFIQEKNEVLEHWWYNQWKETDKFWQFHAFVGLRKQNPLSAAKELPLLIERKLPSTSILLSAFWRDAISKDVFVKTIRKGLNENQSWAGLAMNGAVEKMFPLEVKDFLAALKGNDIKVIENTTQKVLTADI